MSTQHTTQDLGGKAKETVGRATGDHDLQGEGKADQAKAAIKDLGGKVKDLAEDLGHKAEDFGHKVKDAAEKAKDAVVDHKDADRR